MSALTPPAVHCVPNLVHCSMHALPEHGVQDLLIYRVFSLALRTAAFSIFVAQGSQHVGRDTYQSINELHFNSLGANRGLTDCQMSTELNM